MKELINPQRDSKYTHIEFEDNPVFHAPHHFVVKRADDGSILNKIDFQEGPILEHGVNGVTNEDLIAIVITRLQGFQESKFACRENALALTKLEEGFMWLRSRTLAREARGVEGKEIV